MSEYVSIKTGQCVDCRGERLRTAGVGDRLHPNLTMPIQRHHVAQNSIVTSGLVPALSRGVHSSVAYGLDWTLLRTVIQIIKAYKLAKGKLDRGEWTDKTAHCYLSCRLTQLLGPLNSLGIGALKEVVDAIKKAVGMGGEGFSFQDLAADAAGVGCSTSSAGCVECCEEET